MSVSSYLALVDFLERLPLPATLLVVVVAIAFSVVLAIWLRRRISKMFRDDP